MLCADSMPRANETQPSRPPTVHIVFNGDNHTTDEHTTVALLLEQHGLALQPVAVEVNSEVVPRAEHAEFKLQDGDRIEVVTLVGGG